MLLAAPSLAAAGVAPQNVGLGTLIQGASDAGEHAIAHYRSETGPGFVLDTLAPKPLLQFDDSAEMWVLTAKRGPRGDIIYYNDVGAQMLRAPRIGGMTVYPPHNAKGMAASFDQPANPLGVILPLNQAAFDGHFQLARKLLQHALPNIQKFALVADSEAPKGKEVAWAAFAIDAANVAAETIDRLSQTPANRKTLARLAAVRINYGPSSSVKLNKDELVIEIVPVQGVAGRPSSARIEAALGLH